MFITCRSNSERHLMSSKELLELINQVRHSVGEPLLRLNSFNVKIEDELDGENYTKNVVQNFNNTESIVFQLTLDQCMLIGMRESKAVRKNVLAALKQKQTPLLPQSFSEALQLAADQARKIEEDKPKVDYYEKIVVRDTLLNATQVAQKIGLSAIALNKLLDSLKVYSHGVKRARVFQQWFIDKGFGELKQTDLGYSQPMFTTKGEAWVIQKLVSEGAIS
ncbi:TPA: phage antirepressor KilAC domain-containing protein [Acinetobacter baumannii]|uniref:phage antirepressor KilAC domain-containing protein n=1 Tax=Acinetobacter calcoaceticus/baumannii complex TaxID=909768 RepID=UPI000810AA66|nr:MULTISPECIES: phage antirepressor KilAC domain-containing protein [Acinetobacter calcoaceticus/baumannii complex]ELY0557745.1 phage antirepressor KilAC domain-containing protein [Acinetobacter baumannii]KAB1601772.1 DNA-binding protein [Acinetobacter baumannii]MBO0621493.1 phage antirepressor KilAC domain-containing protein [Acinetobacter baumannii]MDA4865009.1 phage antirepressor KilAC domain-containing protein [Acinetobacter baumannii]MDC5598947.1 phage antirepressor KilAC domain-containi